MALTVFKPFEQAPYPCYFLQADGTLILNAAAQAAAPPLSDSKTMTSLLLAARAGADTDKNAHASTLPLLTDALSLRTLTLLPTEEGLLAVAQQEKVTPVNAFSSQMREPLTNIFAVLPLLSARLDDTDSRYIDEIQSSSYQLLRLASNLEDAGQVEKRAFSTKPVDLVSLVESLCYCVQSVCKDQGVAIEWSLPDHPLPVQADARLLSESFLNMVRNSLQYTRDGNVIRVKLASAGGQAVLTVEDKGLGIKPEFLPHVFEPYFSVDPYGDTPARPGTGLGLSVVRETARGFGGTVNVESRFGEGTRVFAALPLAEDGGEILESDSADYLLNRFSPVYVQLCGYCRLPQL